jgi:hypothetical protein
VSSGLSVIITFDLFLREQHHLGRRIPEEEQLCSFELFLAFVSYAKWVLKDVTKKLPFKKNFSLTISLLVLATGEHYKFSHCSKKLHLDQQDLHS